MITKSVEEYSELEKLIYPALCALEEMKSFPVRTDGYLSEMQVLYFNLDQKEFKLVSVNYSYDAKMWDEIAEEDSRLHQIKVGEIITIVSVSKEISAIICSITFEFLETIIGTPYKDADGIAENFHKLRNRTELINRDIDSFREFINQNQDIKSQMYLSISGI